MSNEIIDATVKILAVLFVLLVCAFGIGAAWVNNWRKW